MENKRRHYSKTFLHKRRSDKYTRKITQKSFKICQTILISDEKAANKLALESLEKGATAIQFVAKRKFNHTLLLDGLNYSATCIYFKFEFLDAAFVNEISQYIGSNNCFSK